MSDIEETRIPEPSKKKQQDREASGSGVIIRAARIKRGWSQAELAKRAGVSQVTVSYVEHGQAGKGRDAICQVLRIRKKVTE